MCIRDRSNSLLSLSQALAAADNRGQTMLKGLENFFIDRLICLSKILSALGMTDDHVLYAGIRQHGRRNLSRKRALFLVIHILGSNLNVGSVSYTHLDVYKRPVLASSSPAARAASGP